MFGAVLLVESVAGTEHDLDTTQPEVAIRVTSGIENLKKKFNFFN
jgi:hypothetical protein